MLSLEHSLDTAREQRQLGLVSVGARTEASKEQSIATASGLLTWVQSLSA